MRTRELCSMQNPVSYTVYGVVASQLGTVDNEFVIQVGHGKHSGKLGRTAANVAHPFTGAKLLPSMLGCAAQSDGTRVSVSEFLDIFYGFRYSFMGPVVAILIAFCIGMWLMTVLALRCDAVAISSIKSDLVEQPVAPDIVHTFGRANMLLFIAGS